MPEWHSIGSSHRGLRASSFVDDQYSCFQYNDDIIFVGIEAIHVGVRSMVFDN